eukprot:901142-Pyramimonas_sp.AAC.1
MAGAAPNSSAEPTSGSTFASAMGRHMAGVAAVGERNAAFCVDYVIRGTRAIRSVCAVREQPRPQGSEARTLLDF